MVGPVLRHSGELIRPDERRYTHPGADRVVRVQHCLGDRRWRSALGRWGVLAAIWWIARTYMGRNCREIARGHQLEAVEDQQNEQRAHDIQSSRNIFRAAMVRGAQSSGYLFGLPNWHSTVPQYLLLRPRDGGNISYALGRDRQSSFFARRSQRRRRRRAAVSTVRLVFLEVFHMLMLVGIADSGHPPNTASCCTISCVIARDDRSHRVSLSDACIHDGFESLRVRIASTTPHPLIALHSCKIVV